MFVPGVVAREVVPPGISGAAEDLRGQHRREGRLRPPERQKHVPPQGEVSQSDQKDSRCCRRDCTERGTYIPPRTLTTHSIVIENEVQYRGEGGKGNLRRRARARYFT